MRASSPQTSPLSSAVLHHPCLHRPPTPLLRAAVGPRVPVGPTRAGLATVNAPVGGCPTHGRRIRSAPSLSGVSSPAAASSPSVARAPSPLIAHVPCMHLYYLPARALSVVCFFLANCLLCLLCLAGCHFLQTLCAARAGLSCPWGRTPWPRRLGHTGALFGGAGDPHLGQAAAPNMGQTALETGGGSGLGRSGSRRAGGVSSGGAPCPCLPQPPSPCPSPNRNLVGQLARLQPDRPLGTGLPRPSRDPRGLVLQGTPGAGPHLGAGGCGP